MTNGIHRRQAGFAALAAIAALASARGQAATPDEAALSDAIARFYKAYVEVDGEAFDKVLSDQLSFGHSDGRIESKQRVISGILSKRILFKNFSFENEQITVSSEVAIVRHLATIESLAAGKSVVGKVNVLLVWHKQGGEWKLIARQAMAVA
ncbi:MAG: protein of unassigned function [Ramlibacter sp.]|nr:protein of unassigned function [Ramlibacter sp.]